jgi:hypothetical protein
MMRRSLAVAGILAGIVTVASPATATAPAAPHRAVWMRTACAEEDSVNCFWNAHAMGNGVGHSFYARRMPGDVTGLVCIFYASPRYARNHDHCSPR